MQYTDESYPDDTLPPAPAREGPESSARMPGATKPSNKTTRVQFEASSATNESLGWLAKTLGVRRADVLRKAIRLLYIVIEAHEKGAKFQIVHDDEPPRELLIL